MSAGFKTIHYQERYMKCASCSSDARWMIIPDGKDLGSTSCERHRATWERRATEAVAS